MYVHHLMKLLVYLEASDNFGVCCLCWFVREYDYYRVLICLSVDRSSRWVGPMSRGGQAMAALSSGQKSEYPW